MDESCCSVVSPPRSITVLWGHGWERTGTAWVTCRGRGKEPDAGVNDCAAVSGGYCSGDCVSVDWGGMRDYFRFILSGSGALFIFLYLSILFRVTCPIIEFAPQFFVLHFSQCLIPVWNGY